MRNELKSFLTLSPGEKWDYPQVDLGEGQRALDIQSKIRSKLDQLGVPDHIFAHCLIDGHSRVFQSPLDGVKEVSSFENADSLRHLGAQTMNNLRESVKNDRAWLTWFDAILKNVSLYSDGHQVVFVWGLELTEKEKFTPSVPPTPTPTPTPTPAPTPAPTPTPTPASAPTPTPTPPPTPPPLPPELTPKPPRRWPWFTWLLWLLILLLFLMWLWLLGWCSRPCDRIHVGYINGDEIVNPLPERLPADPNVAIPWDPEDIEQDSTSGQLFLADRWNIAYTDRDQSFDQFVAAVDSLIPEDKGDIIYWDPLIGRIQVTWRDESVFPVSELRQELALFQGLIWPERLMSNGASVVSSSSAETDATWHLDAIGWERQQPSPTQGVGIAVVDDGFDLEGSRLSEVSRFAFNVQNRDSDVSASDFRNHGTHVASLAVAPERGATAFEGVSNSSTLIPVQIHSDDIEMLPTSNIVDGILYATRKGAKIINLSLGMPLPKPWQEMAAPEKWFFREVFRELSLDERLFWSHLFDSLEQEGVVVVIAAGNDGAPLELDPMHESRFPIYVTASQPDGKLASFSNTRSEGNDSLTVVTAPGFEVHSWVPGNKLMPMSGTSMAAPIVAGSIAEMMAQNGAMSPRQVREKFQRMPESFSGAGVKLWIPLLLNDQTYN